MRIARGQLLKALAALFALELVDRHPPVIVIPKTEGRDFK